MPTLYLDTAMGAAGDMLAAALLELDADPDGVLTTMNSLRLPGVQISTAVEARAGITGTRFLVNVDGQPEHSHDHQHTHHRLTDVHGIIESLPLPGPVIADALAVYQLLAEAETKVHGTTTDLIHFHEVGTLDAIADIVAVCLLMHRLAPGRVLCSPVTVGSGQVRSAHGVLPVPAPATAELLRGIPIVGGPIRAELCTPTGAALLKHFVTEFVPALPAFTIDRIGHGVGSKEFEAANVVRSILGIATPTVGETDQIVQLSTSLDDMTGEEIAFAVEELLAAGALDAYTTAITMKKGRPAVLLTCLCAPELADDLAGQIFRHTSTLGIRRELVGRYVLSRELLVAETRFGPVRMKRSFTGREWHEKAEYDDLARIAREHDLPLAEVRRQLAIPGPVRPPGGRPQAE
ncbi:MAG: nickel pincer cofactor biosynthesis protein LarC [Brooklawnia sp.]|jgi:uncharacterized protein (TIGR00299 family) protein